MLQIVILGGGFAGTAALQHLDRRFRHDAEVAITLISQQNYIVFTPLLAEVAGNSVEPRHAVPPLRAFCHTARFREGMVRGVDLPARRVLVEYPDGRRVRVALDWALELVLPPDIVQLPILMASGGSSVSAERLPRPDSRDEPMEQSHAR